MEHRHKKYRSAAAPKMSTPAGGLQQCIRKGKAMLLALMKSKDKTPELRKLLKHARHRNIKFVQRGGFKTFVMNRNIVLDGLTRQLKGAFWKSSTAPKTRQGDTKTQMTANTGGCYYQGRSRKHGLRVHSDFARMVKCMTRQTTIKKGGAYSVGKVDACAFRMFIRLTQKGIVPIICEMAVYNEYLRQATAIDCIAYDTRTNRVIAIEIKTGHLAQRNYSAHDGRTSLKAPLDNTPDTPLNRAAIQLLITLIILRRRYDIHVHDALIVRPLGMTGVVQLYKIPPKLILPGYQHILCAALKAYINKSDTSRSYDIPVSKKVRETFQSDRSVQRAKERMLDPRSNVFWQPIAPVRTPAHPLGPEPDALGPQSDPETSEDDSSDVEPDSSDVEITSGASAERDIEYLFDDSIEEDCPPPCAVTVEVVAQPPAPPPAPPPVIVPQTGEFSWEAFFGITAAPEKTGPLLSWDKIESELRGTYGHGRY